MAVSTFDAEPRTVFFSDAAVFGRVSNALGAYAERMLADGDFVHDQLEDAMEEAQKKNGIIARIRASVARFQAYMTRRRTIAELNKLDDATLADIGIARADIRELVNR